jgi:hypothetical protein
MAGGYQGDYRKDNETDADMFERFGGKELDSAWMFDGSSWNTLAKMSTTRDRPACSLVYMSDRSVRILVAGGCVGWCINSPGIASAEMYAPMTNTWTKVADLPTGINSAKMELLDGLPTIVGGYNGETRNGILYQYHPDLDLWKEHPNAKMRIPRSSATVFQVPRLMFPNCYHEGQP